MGLPGATCPVCGTATMPLYAHIHGGAVRHLCPGCGLEFDLLEPGRGENRQHVDVTSRTTYSRETPDEKGPRPWQGRGPSIVGGEPLRSSHRGVRADSRSDRETTS